MKQINIMYDGRVTNDEPYYANGTSLQGEFEASYAEVAWTFGEPNSQGDDDKVTVCWVIHTPSGVATIYNWKTYGVETVDITNWHIGGKDKDVVEWVMKALAKNERGTK